jgi:hypothetical protein
MDSSDSSRFAKFQKDCPQEAGHEEGASHEKGPGQKEKTPKKAGVSSIVKGRKRRAGDKLLSSVLKNKKSLKSASTATKKRKSTKNDAESSATKPKKRLKLSLSNLKAKVDNYDSSENDDNVAVAVHEQSDDERDSNAFAGDSDNDDQNTNDNADDDDDSNDDESEDDDSRSAVAYPMLHSKHSASKEDSFELDDGDDDQEEEEEENDGGTARAKHPYMAAAWNSFNRNSITDTEQIYSTFNATGNGASAAMDDSESEEDPF